MCYAQLVVWHGSKTQSEQFLQRCPVLQTLNMMAKKARKGQEWEWKARTWIPKFNAGDPCRHFLTGRPGVVQKAPPGSHMNVFFCDLGIVEVRRKTDFAKVIVATSATLPGSPSIQHHGKESDEGSSCSPQEGNVGEKANKA